jgi:hypothetical protein
MNNGYTIIHHSLFFIQYSYILKQMSNQMKWLKWSTYILLLIYTFAIFFKSDNSFEQDLGRHLKMGEIMVRDHFIPQTNLFSYTHPDFPFVNHHYLFGVLVYLASVTVGIQGIFYIKIVLVLLIAAILIKLLVDKNVIIALPVAFIFLHLLRERTEVRPELFSFLFTVIVYYILEKFESDRISNLSRLSNLSHLKPKLIFLLPLIQLIWINMHIYFPVGFFLEGIYFVWFASKREWRKAKLLFAISTLSFIVSFINPNTIKAVFYPFQIFQNYGYTIVENQTIFFLEDYGFRNPNFLFYKLAVLIIVIGCIVGLLTKHLNLKNGLLILLGLGLSLTNVRSFPYLVLISLPAVVWLGQKIRTNMAAYVVWAVMAFLLILESSLYLTNTYYKFDESGEYAQAAIPETGKPALDFVIDNDLPQPILNNYDNGGYVIYRGYREYKVFVDNRPEAYPKEFFQQVYIPMQEQPEVFKQIDDRYHFQTIIFNHTDQTPWAQTFLKAMVKDTSWTPVYFDRYMLILVRTDQARSKNLTSVDMATLSPDKYTYTDHQAYFLMGYSLLNWGYTTSSEAFLNKALSIFPDSPKTNLLMANIVAMRQNPLEARLIDQYLSKSKNPYWW